MMQVVNFNEEKVSFLIKKLARRCFSLEKRQVSPACELLLAWQTDWMQCTKRAGLSGEAGRQKEKPGSRQQKAVPGEERCF
jgi:hypothetical protein